MILYLPECTCSSVVGVCVGSCGGKPLWSFWGRKEIEDQEDEERGADMNGACNCSRQTSGGCAVTKNLCISGSKYPYPGVLKAHGGIEDWSSCPLPPFIFPPKRS